MLSRGFWGSKKSLPKISRQHRQHAEPGQTLRQSGNKPESTFTSQAQYRALAIGFWRIISAMLHTSEYNICSVETCFYMLLYCMHVHNRNYNRNYVVTNYRFVMVLSIFDIHMHHKLDVTILERKGYNFITTSNPAITFVANSVPWVRGH